MSEQEEKPAAAPESAPEQPKKKGGVVGAVIGAIVVIAVVAGAGLAYMYLTGDVKAKVGDCITETVKADASDAKVVDCSKPEAKNKVIGIVENVPESDMADADKAQAICDTKYPEWENVIWHGKSGGTGDAWCLTKIQ